MSKKQRPPRRESKDVERIEIFLHPEVERNREWNELAIADKIDCEVGCGNCEWLSVCEWRDVVNDWFGYEYYKRG